jgi:hypothetical protein
MYFKSNNNIKGFYKDPILNDFIYFASNGLKKNVIFRKNEIQDKNYQNSFVSYFHNIEDQLLIFNIYPQKYNSDLFSRHKNLRSIFENFNIKNEKKSEINSFFLSNYNLNKDVGINNYFIKNYYDKYYFLDSIGNVKQLNGKLFQKNLFSGLLYVLPKNIQKSFKTLFSINYLLISFYNNLINLRNKNAIAKTNVLLYFLYLKFLNFKIGEYLSINKIKIRKSNWLLYKYVQLYLPQISLLSNFLYTIISKKLNSNNIFLLNQLTWEKNIFNKISNISFIFKNNKELNKDSKLLLLKTILTFLTLNFDNYVKNINSNMNLLSIYLIKKININKNILNLYLNKNIKKNFVFSFTNYFINLNNNLIYCKPNLYHEAHISLSQDLLSKSNDINFKEGDFFINRKFLKLFTIKNIIRFKKINEQNRIAPYTNVSSVKNLKSLKKDIAKFKRSFVRKRKNKKVFKKTSKIFTLASRNFKIAKLQKIKQPWLRIYNKLNTRQQFKTI